MGTRVIVWLKGTSVGTRVLHYHQLFQQCMANSGLGKMHLDLYTQNAGLTHKAKFWCNYVSALKDARNYGPIGLLARDEPVTKIPKPSIWSLYRPMDITVYDLLYEDEYRERLFREYEFDCDRIVNTHYRPL